LRRQQAAGEVTLLDRNAARVQVILQDGKPYEHEGTLDFFDYSVNPTTGALAFRGIVPNPDRVLLPGMYVNVRLTLGHSNHAFLVPAAALQRDDQGPFVKVVGADDKVVQKRVVADTIQGSSWVVTSGVAEGDRLVVLNSQRARPGTVVKVAPASAPSDSGGSGPSGKQ
jgi:membrane fusion protein (multidrug efflux system)